MVKIKEFKGNINIHSVEESLNKFIKELRQDQILDVKYNSNVVNIKKENGSTDVILLSSVLLMYEE